MAPAFLLAALGHGEFVRPGCTPADEIMRAVLHAADDAVDLRHFLEGAAEQVAVSLIDLIDRPLLLEED